jgi:uncharacterized protein YggE
MEIQQQHIQATSPKGDIKKKLMIGIVGLVLLGLIIRNLSFKSVPDTITVNAVGRYTAKPNLAKITLGWYGKDIVLTEALRKERDIQNNIINKITGFGVKNEDVQISYPKSTYTGSEFQVVNAMTFIARDLSKIDDLMAALYNAGALSVESPVFETKDFQGAEAGVSMKTMEDARTKAEKAARSAGKSLGGVVSIAFQNTLETGTTNNAITTIVDGVRKIDNIELIRTATVVFELK